MTLSLNFSRVNDLNLHMVMVRVEKSLGVPVPACSPCVASECVPIDVALNRHAKVKVKGVCVAPSLVMY